MKMNKLGKHITSTESIINRCMDANYPKEICLRNRFRKALSIKMFKPFAELWRSNDNLVIEVTRMLFGVPENRFNSFLRRRREEND